jgi:hypothetical protein
MGWTLCSFLKQLAYSGRLQQTTSAVGLLVTSSPAWSSPGTFWGCGVLRCWPHSQSRFPVHYRQCVQGACRFTGAAADAAADDRPAGTPVVPPSLRLTPALEHQLSGVANRRAQIERLLSGGTGGHDSNSRSVSGYGTSGAPLENLLPGEVVGDSAGRDSKGKSRSSPSASASMQEPCRAAEPERDISIAELQREYGNINHLADGWVELCQLRHEVHVTDRSVLLLHKPSLLTLLAGHLLTRYRVQASWCGIATQIADVRALEADAERESDNALAAEIKAELARLQVTLPKHVGSIRSVCISCVQFSSWCFGAVAGVLGCCSLLRS